MVHRLLYSVDLDTVRVPYERETQGVDQLPYQACPKGIWGFNSQLDAASLSWRNQVAMSFSTNIVATKGIVF